MCQACVGARSSLSQARTTGPCMSPGHLAPFPGIDQPMQVLLLEDNVENLYRHVTRYP